VRLHSKAFRGPGVRKPSRRGPELPQVAPIALPGVFQQCRGRACAGGFECNGLFATVIRLGWKTVLAGRKISFMNKALVLGFLSLLINTCALFAQQTLNAHSIPAEVDLQQKVSVHMENAFASDVFDYLISAHRVPSGVLITSAIRDRRVSVEVSDVSLRQVLDLLTQEDASYRWELRNGVLNFIGTSPAQELLKAKISNFRLQNASTQQLYDALSNQAELQAALKRIGLEDGNLHLWKPSERHGPALNIDLHDVTFGDLLNELAKQRLYWSASVLGKVFFLHVSEALDVSAGLKRMP
jgi:hypothetical protein